MVFKNGDVLRKIIFDVSEKTDEIIQNNVVKITVNDTFEINEKKTATSRTIIDSKKENKQTRETKTLNEPLK